MLVVGLRHLSVGLSLAWQRRTIGLRCRMTLGCRLDRILLGNRLRAIMAAV